MYLKGLDYIRVASALAVVMYHYFARSTIEHDWEALRIVSQFGYIGVPCFFILSGFVIAYTADNSDAKRFLVSRFFRLIPTLWLCIGITSIFVFIFEAHEFNIAQILANLTTLNHYIGYTDVDVVYWSLKAEIKFYGLIFFLMLIGLYVRKILWLTIWFCLLLSYHSIDLPKQLGWFISPHYSSYFIVGICLYQMKMNKIKLFILPFILSSCLSIYNAYYQATDYIIEVEDVERFIASALVFIVILTFYFVTKTKSEKKVASKGSLLPTMAGLTYPLYLLHNKAGSIVILNYQDTINTEFLMISMIFFMLLLSAAIHLYFEKVWVSKIRKAFDTKTQRLFK